VSASVNIKLKRSIETTTGTLNRSTLKYDSKRVNSKNQSVNVAPEYGSFLTYTTNVASETIKPED